MTRKALSLAILTLVYCAMSIGAVVLFAGCGGASSDAKVMARKMGTFPLVVAAAGGRGHVNVVVDPSAEFYAVEGVGMRSPGGTRATFDGDIDPSRVSAEQIREYMNLLKLLWEDEAAEDQPTEPSGES